jgi:hypothetical protein
MEPSHTLPLRTLLFIMAAFLAATLWGCGPDRPPLEDIRQELADSSTYSVVLENMKQDGTFFKKHFHQYQIATPAKTWATGWLEVPKEFYQRHAMYLGMTIAGAKDGEPLLAAAPPGYQYVGDPRYGRWRSGPGGELWAFNRNTPLFDELEIDIDFPPIYRADYRKYRSSHSKGVPYFGGKGQFGTQGSYTKKAKPNFFQRQQAKASMKSASFSEKVSKSIGRTRTGYRGRSGGRGK